MASAESRGSSFGIFSGSTVKIIACIFMLIDHMGLILFPDIILFRAIGRLAFPLFAYTIAEGCHYTKRKVKRFLLIFSIGIGYLIFYYFLSGVFYASIFMTFSVSILLIELLDQVKAYAFSDFKPYKLALAALAIAAALVCAYFLFEYVSFDYGFLGMMVPVLVNLFDFRSLPVPKYLAALDSFYVRFLMFTIGLILICIFNTHYPITVFGLTFPLQWLSLLSLPFILFYNGKPGRAKLKYSFYLFYPIHIVLLEAIAMAIELFK